MLHDKEQHSGTRVNKGSNIFFSSVVQAQLPLHQEACLEISQAAYLALRQRLHRLEGSSVQRPPQLQLRRACLDQLNLHSRLQEVYLEVRQLLPNLNQEGYSELPQRLLNHNLEVCLDRLNLHSKLREDYLGLHQHQLNLQVDCLEARQHLRSLKLGVYSARLQHKHKHSQVEDFSVD